MNLKHIYSQLMIGMLLLTGTGFAQENPGLRERAEQLFREYRYADAVPFYQKLVDVKKPRLSDLEHLAASYQKMNDYEAAENWYARVTAHPESPAGNLLLYGEILKANGRYAEAKKVFQDYAAKTGDEAKVRLSIAGCDSARHWLANPSLHQLQNESGINTERAEFSAFPLGDTVYFAGEPDAALFKDTYGWTGQPFLRVYSAGIGSGGLANAALTSLGFNTNEPYHTGPLASNRAGTVYYVTRTYPEKQGTAINKEAGKTYRTHKLEIYIYRKGPGGEWEASPFAYNDVSHYSVGHAALSADERVLYFAADMPGGLGGTDIWYCGLQDDGSWGQPQHAGPAINTAGDELFPNVAPDGTLYYSSDGLAGMGGLDIFSSKGQNNDWTTPQNLGYPVNSAGDDFSYITREPTDAGFRGYLSSNRKGGKGGDDIYSFSYQQPKIILALKGVSYNKATGEVLPETSVSLYVNGRELKGRQDSRQDGSFFFELEKNQDYQVLGQKVKYHADSARVSTQGINQSDTLEVTLYLEPVFEVGKTFELENIHYDFDKHNIRQDAAAILDELVRTLRDNPTLKIELSSHTDSRGSDAYNMALSQRRAQSAVDYLVSRGIARERMEAKGYGESRLLNRCANGVPCSKAEHQANRRTEVTVMEY